MTADSVNAVCLLGLGDHDGLEELVQFVLHEVGEVADACVVILDHVQVQLKLLGDGGCSVLGVSILRPGLTGRGAGRQHATHRFHSMMKHTGTGSVCCQTNSCKVLPVFQHGTVIISMLYTDYYSACRPSSCGAPILELIWNAGVKCKRVKLMLLAEMGMV